MKYNLLLSFAELKILSYVMHDAHKREPDRCERSRLGSIARRVDNMLCTAAQPKKDG